MIPIIYVVMLLAVVAAIGGLVYAVSHTGSGMFPFPDELGCLIFIIGAVVFFACVMFKAGWYFHG